MRNRELSRPLKLRDGRALQTFAEVVDVFDSVFASLIRDAALAHAIQLMEKAAETGKRSDIKAATNQAELVLRRAGLTN